MSGKPIPTIRPEHLELIYRQARAEFPSECCGYILGDGPQAELVACENQIDKLHALDPEIYPRTSATAYAIHGKQLIALMTSFDSDKPARIVYHSHPRVGAYFSEEDTLVAIRSGWEVDYLVVDVQDDEIKEALLFRRVDGQERFEQIARFDGAAL
ncbi:MAG: Mov34/MPN/PAD-1 family protein [Myxococcota bacterium]